MDVTSPRSPVIARAMAAYVVSEVTTLTLPPGGCGAAGCRAPSRRIALSSMSVGLVFVGADGPYGLNGELARGVEARALRPRVLRAEEHPLALPQRQGRDELAGDHAAQGV